MRMFKAGDLIEGFDVMSGAKGRIIAVTDTGYKIFWVGEQYRSMDQFQIHPFQMVETFYRKAMS